MSYTTFTTPEGKIITVSDSTSVAALIDDLLFTLTFLITTDMPPDVESQLISFTKYLQELKHECSSSGDT